MTLTVGQTLTHYQILGPLGAGGMGEVYRAKDTRLDREVAIKVLPEELADDDERLRRFEREAKILASLHHANVASIFGIDQVDHTCFIAMELVPGEDLATRLERGALPVDEALDVCRQIAEGLEAAHEAGVIHRDLKPANVRLTPDGVAKVLDFGLAKPAPPGGAGTGLVTAVPARPDSFLVTEEGMVLGTPTYMSPEQARAKPVDQRTDIWAFGCVLFECLAGRRAFGGESLTDVLAAIVEREPDWSALPPGTPPSVRALLSRCLVKDPRTRLRDVGEARIVLTDATRAPLSGTVATAPTTPVRSTNPASVWGPRLGIGVLGLALGWAAAWALASDPAQKAPNATHFDLVLDPPQRVDHIALSPDGSCLVYASSIDGVRQLFARRLDGHASEAIAGSEGGTIPFFSPDGRNVAFLAAGQIRRVPLEGGVPEVIAAASGVLSSAIWMPDDTIVFGTEATRVPMRVQARAGGVPKPIPVSDLEPGMSMQAARPLPGGRTVLVTVLDGTELGKRIAVLDLETGDWMPVTRGENGFFVPPDRLVYVHQSQVMVTGFDPATGATVDVPRITDLLSPALFRREGIDRFYAATSGDVLVYPSGKFSRRSRILRVSPDGQTTATGLTGVIPKADSAGRRVAVCRWDQTVHVLDLVEQTERPLTFLGTSWHPMWSPDDEHIVFQDSRRVVLESLTVPSNGSGTPELMFEDSFPSDVTTSVSADGTWMGYVIDPVTNRDIWIRRPGEAFELILATPANERAPILSPDGRLFAYVSDEDGSDQIYLRDLASLERRWPVTTKGGTSPVWSRDGSRLYFIRGESLLAVDVRRDGGLRIGRENLIVTQPGLDRDDWGNRTFDTMPDGDLLISVEEPSDVTLRVVLGWDP